MTNEEVLRWIAARSVAGRPIGTSVLRDELGLSARDAQLAMGGGWLRFVEAERTRLLDLCPTCGEPRRHNRAWHERECERIPELPAVVEVVPETCPRCGGTLIRNHDERECLVHGTVYTPNRAWDQSDFGIAPVDVLDGRTRRRGASHKGSAVSA